MKQGQAHRKARAKLERRLADHTALMASSNPESSKKAQRKENGGYHRPGSMKVYG